MPTTQEKVNIWYGANGSETEERQYPEGQLQTFKRGDLVYLSSGYVVAAASVAGNVASGTKVLGIALRDAGNLASNSSTNNMAVALANANLRWVLPITHATPASAVTLITHVGSVFELERTAAGKWAVPVDDTTNHKVVVTALHPAYPIGEQYGWVEVQFEDAAVDVRV